MLLPKEEADVLLRKRDPKLTSVAVLTRFVLDSTKYRLGRTKVEQSQHYAVRCS